MRKDSSTNTGRAGKKVCQDCKVESVQCVDGDRNQMKDGGWDRCRLIGVCDEGRQKAGALLMGGKRSRVGFNVGWVGWLGREKEPKVPRNQSMAQGVAASDRNGRTQAVEWVQVQAAATI